MATINKKPITKKTYEGLTACHINPEQELKRSVMACLLWENTFYEDGVSISDRIVSLVKKVKPEVVSDIAIKARTEMKLRHVPLLLAVELARQGNLKSELLESIIQRPDELTEFLALYWKDGKCPLSAQAKKGLAKAFNKFDEYQLAKYNRDNKIKLRDVLFLCHAKPKDKEQEFLFKKLVNNELAIPDTWETNLSVGKDKKETWSRLLTENKLGGLALLRNLRNMFSSNINIDLIKNALLNINVKNILPFRFIAAARYAPQIESTIEISLYKCLSEMQKITGKTIILVDVSGSMDSELSNKSDMTRIDAACGVAICLRNICKDVSIYSFSQDCVLIPDRHGFALRDAIKNSQDHSSTYLGRAVDKINKSEGNYDRIVIITDEQSHDTIVEPLNKGYIINVASYQNGVGYGQYLHINGFSESVIKYIQEYEKQFDN
jgi:hypothetical protein